MVKRWVIIPYLILSGLALAAPIYKWVDEDGKVHYSDQPPGGEVKAEEFVPQPAPPADAHSPQEQLSPMHDEAQAQPQPTAARSLSISELGPLPDNEVTQYIETISTGISFDAEKLSARFSIMVKARRGLPRGAYLEVHFPDPADATNSVVVGKVRRGLTSKLFISSPPLKGFKCRNYEVTIYIYRGSSKSKLLGTHYQFIQARINLDKVKDKMDLVDAIGKCP